MSLHDPDGAPWRTPARRRGPPRPQVRLRVRRPRGGGHPVGVERQPVPADRQRGHDRRQPPGRHREARVGHVRALRARSSRRRRRTSTTSRRSRWRSSCRTRGSSRAAPAGSTTRSGVVRLLAERYGVVPQALPDIRLTAAQLARREARDRTVAGDARRDRGGGAPGRVEGGHEGARHRPRRGRLVRPRDAVAARARPPRRGPAGGAPRVGGVGRHAGEGSEDRRRGGHVREPRPALAPPVDEAVARRAHRLVWHEPLPLEFARETAPLDALLGAALKAASVATQPAEAGVAVRVLEAPKAVLVAVINETPAKTVRRAVVGGRTVSIPVEPLRSRLVLVDKSGKVIADTPGEPVR